MGGLAGLIAGCPRAEAPNGTANPCDQPGVICTVAGTGLSAFDGDGRPARRTSLYFPLDVEFDASGRPLILDWNNIRVRRINDDTSVETIIGLAYEDEPTDGALAKETPLHHASDIEFDSAGRMYVAGNHAPVVFRVELDNRVVVLAGGEEIGNDGDGGPAREAKLTAPHGVLPLDDGSFYIADIEADVIRYVDAAGIISTVAGNGTRGYSGDGGLATLAQLSGATRLARDSQGSLYFSDSNNHAIRRVAPDGVITTFAGIGAGYSGDGGLAKLAQLRSPHGLRFGPTGELFVADTGNHVIRRIDGDGFITTVVGTATPGFDGDEGEARSCLLNGPAGVSFDAGGAMWIADTLNQRVRRVSSSRK